MKNHRELGVWCFLIFLLIPSPSKGNIFRAPPPHDEQILVDAQPFRASTNTSLAIADNVSDQDCNTILPALNVTCSNFQAQDGFRFPSLLVSTFYNSLDVSSYCDCPATTTIVPACGGLCPKAENSNKIVDPTSGLTCGEVTSLASFVKNSQVCPIFVAMSALCCTTMMDGTLVTIPMSFSLYNATQNNTLDSNLLEQSLQNFVEELTSNSPSVRLVNQSTTLDSNIQETDCSTLQGGTAPCFQISGRYNANLTTSELDEAEIQQASNDPSLFQPHVDAQFGNQTWIVRQGTPIDTQEECSFCKVNQSQPFWLPTDNFSKEWRESEFCPILKSIYAQEAYSNCAFYDTLVHQTLQRRIQSHPIWALPVNLRSLCGCPSSNWPQPVFCPSGTIVPPSLANSTAGAGLTCDQTNLLFPHISDPTIQERLALYTPLCCKEVFLPPNSDARPQQIRTSFVTADLTTSDLDNLEEAFAEMVKDLTKPQQLRLRRLARVLSIQLDPTSPRLYNMQNVTCPTFWVSSEDCQTVNASYNLFVTNGEDTSMYVNRTNEAIDNGLFYQQLRRIHPATTVAILGTPSTAFARATEDDDDADGNSTVVRIVSFFLGLGLGITIALICVAIGHRISNIIRIERERPLAGEEANQDNKMDTNSNYLSDPASPEQKEVFSPTRPRKPQSMEEEKQPLMSEMDADFAGELVESPIQNVDAEMLVYGGSYTSDSPPDGSIVAKALFQRGEELFEEDVESLLMQRMEQECTSVVNSSSASSTISSRSLDDVDQPAKGESSVSHIPADRVRSGEVMPEVEEEAEEREIESNTKPDPDETKVDESKGDGDPSEGIVFETLALGGFGHEEVNVTLAVTSASSSSSPGDDQQQGENGSGSTASNDLASELCFQGQPRQIGFPSP